MKRTTLCYIEKNGKYLMLHRIKKENDENKDKWIGVGGKIEPGETDDECILRETFEETGLRLNSIVKRGVIYFKSDIWEDEEMVLYTSDDFEGELIECNEGNLEWIDKGEICNLNIWEGDKIFLELLIKDRKDFELTLEYNGDKLVKSNVIMPVNEHKHKSVLIFTTRQLCYSSAEYFADMLAKEFKNIGFQVERCTIDESLIPSAMAEFAEPASVNAGKRVDEGAEANLEKYIGMHFDAIFDINSKLPKLVLDDDSYYLDNIDGPFYNIILDHPLYHHSTLVCKLKNYNVLSVDKSHCEYVRKYYKHIKSVNQIILGGVESTYSGKKENCLLFIGTFRNPDRFLDRIRSGNPISLVDMQSMISYMKADPHLLIEDAMKNSLITNGRGALIGEYEFTQKGGVIPTSMVEERRGGKEALDPALVLNSYYLVEQFIRNYRRKWVVDTLIESGLPVKLVGDWWSSYTENDYKNCTISGPVSYEKSFDEIARCSVLVDSSPFFQNGVHDRVFAALANHTAVLTNGSIYRKNELQNAVLFYEDGDKKSLIDMAERLLLDGNYRGYLTEKGYDAYLTKYNWKECVKNLTFILFEY